uniref:Uncharacterized protein n=1 Tax=Anguilla anguilla TaxID=7936 RepID=A0A0E9QPV7_ANGAN
MTPMSKRLIGFVEAEAFRGEAGLQRFQTLPSYMQSCFCASS